VTGLSPSKYQQSIVEFIIESEGKWPNEICMAWSWTNSCAHTRDSLMTLMVHIFRYLLWVYGGLSWPLLTRLSMRYFCVGFGPLGRALKTGFGHIQNCYFSWYVECILHIFILLSDCLFILNTKIGLCLFEQNPSKWYFFKCLACLDGPAESWRFGLLPSW